MRRLGHSGKISALLATMTLILAACSSQSPSPSASSAGSSASPSASATSARDDITVGLRVDVSTMDPYQFPDELSGGTLGKLIWENLVWIEFDSAGKVQYQPLLATSWEKTAPTQWTVELQQGVTFSDGSPFTAEDVKYTFDRYSNPKISEGNVWAIEPWFKSVEVTGDYEVVFTTSYEMPDLFAWIAYAPKIVSKTAIEKAGQQDAQELTGDAAVGTGKFTLANYVKGEEVLLQRNDRYWGDPAKLKTIKFVPIPDDQARIAALQTGQVDLITTVPPAQVAGLQSNTDLHVEVQASARYTYIWLNTLTAPFNNVKARQAVNYAVDVKAMSESLFLGMDKPADAPLAPSNFGYCPQTPYAFDPDKAKQLLTDAGLTQPVAVEFWSPQARYLQDREIATAVQGYMNQAGFTVHLNLQEWGSLSKEIFVEQDQYLKGEIASPTYNMLLISWGSQTLDADYALYPTFHSGQKYNLAYYKNSQVDKLLEDARTASPADRLDLYCQAQKLIWEDSPQLFLHIEPQILAWKNGLQGVSILPFEHYLLQGASWK